MKYLYPLILLLLIAGSAKSQETSTMPQGNHAGQKVTLRQINIEGNKVTRRSVMLREIGISEGAVIATDSIETLKEQVKLRLFNLQLFNEVEQVITYDSSATGIYWSVSVKERWFIIPSLTVQFADRNINTWYVQEHHDLRRAMAGLTLTDKNFRGNLEALAVTVQAGYTQKLGISYMRPYVNKGQTNGLGFSLSMAQSRQTYYNTDSNKLVYAGVYSGPVILKQFEGGISYTYRPAYASRHSFELSYKDFSVADTIVKLNPEYYADKSRRARFMELQYRYEFNGVDNWNYSLEGVKLVVNGVARQGMEGLNFQSYANVEAGLFRSITDKWYYSAIFRGRLMFPQEQPYYFRGGLGTQTDYVRGFEYYIADGSHYGLIRLDLKRELLNKTWSFPLKYFTAIPLRLYPKIFFDAGYIDSPNPGNGFLGNRLLYSYGAGLDVVTLYDVKIRVEVARNHLNQNGLYLHFNSE
jgi:outer membrane protein assembly factor BamA